MAKWMLQRLVVVGIAVWLGPGRSAPLDAAEFRPPRQTPEGFAVPQPGHRFQFPRDHGSHPQFSIEWWYVTGHLFSQTDRRFGFQATFFRRSGPLTNAAATGEFGSTNFGHAELHLAHMALLDTQRERFIYQERLNRSGWDAAAQTNTLEVRNGNWTLRRVETPAEQFLLHGSIRAEAEFSLTLQPAKPLVVFGRNGISRKAAAPTASSYYLTFPRLRVSGQVRLDQQTLPVRGLAWMDHEISSSQLGAEQAGWDWASLQLDDHREIMAYRMRKKDGSTDPHSTLAWVAADGTVTHYSSAQFEWNILKHWTSPVTGARYPARVELIAPEPGSGRRVVFRLEPLLADQELAGNLGGIAYWEGACRVLDAAGHEVGSAYLELTGYAGDLGERFR